jgi:hypothetical protein
MFFKISRIIRETFGFLKTKNHTLVLEINIIRFRVSAEFFAQSKYYIDLNTTGII